MSRTYKDQKQNQAAQLTQKKQRKRRLKRRYIRYKSCGPEEDIRRENELREIMDGDYCPKCGSPTHFDTYYLACVNCDWIDYGEDAIRQPDEWPDEIAA